MKNRVELVEEIFQAHRGPDYGESPGIAIEDIQVKRAQVEYSLSIVRGVPEEPHVVYFPSEFDTENAVKYLAHGFVRLGGTFMWPPYGDAIKGHDVNEYLAIYEDALSSFLDWKAIEGRPGPIVLMGRSLGAGAAINCFKKVEDDALCLVLDSAFNDTNQFFQALGIDKLNLEWDPFRNREVMKTIKKPVLFIHSHCDTVCPIRDVEWVVCESRSKATQFQIVPSEDRWDVAFKGGGLYFEVIWQYIMLRMGRRPPRKKRNRSRHPS